MYTTLNSVRSIFPPVDELEKLQLYLGIDFDGEESLPFKTIMDSNGIYFALRCLKVGEKNTINTIAVRKNIRLLACDLATDVLHIADDKKLNKALKKSRKYAKGKLDLDSLYKAGDICHDKAMKFNSKGMINESLVAWVVWGSTEYDVHNEIVGVAEGARIVDYEHRTGHEWDFAEEDFDTPSPFLAKQEKIFIDWLNQDKNSII